MADTSTPWANQAVSHNTLQTSNTQNEVYSKNYLSFKIHAICPSWGMPKPFCLFLICILNSYPLKTITYVCNIILKKQQLLSCRKVFLFVLIHSDTGSCSNIKPNISCLVLMSKNKNKLDSSGFHSFLQLLKDQLRGSLSPASLNLWAYILSLKYSEHWCDIKLEIKL